MTAYIYRNRKYNLHPQNPLTIPLIRHEMNSKALFFTYWRMKNLFLQKILGIVTVFAMFLAFVPQSVLAAYLGSPTNVNITGGVYTNDTTPTVTWTRPSGATWYQVLLDNGSWINLGNVGTYTLSSQSNGWHTFYVRAQDNSSNVSVSASVTFEIDTIGPTVPAVSPSTAIEDQSVTLTVTPSGESATTSCDLYVSASNTGSMTKNGSTFSKAYTFTNGGSYSVYARCADGDNNYTTGSSRTISVVNNTANDTFIVPSISPSLAYEDKSTTFTIKPYGTLDAIACKLYVSGSNKGSMSKASSNTFTKSYTFTNDGNYTVYASCENENGGWVNGTSRTVNVVNQEDPDNSTNYFDDAAKGSLIKIACGYYANTTDTCKAVYYYGNDGKRHVFPNEGVFYTWYRNFDDVAEVSDDFMASLTIGKNVTYRPGSVVVKFDSSASVYAIEADHTLRHYTTISLLQSDYGNAWTNSLAKVPDSLFGNYTVGSVIDSTSDYDRGTAYYSVDSIDDIL